IGPAPCPLFTGGCCCLTCPAAAAASNPAKTQARINFNFTALLPWLASGRDTERPARGGYRNRPRKRGRCALRVVKGPEDDPNDDSVGLGGLPNEEGVVELDACCM